MNDQLDDIVEALSQFGKVINYLPKDKQKNAASLAREFTTLYKHNQRLLTQIKRQSSYIETLEEQRRRLLETEGPVYFSFFEVDCDCAQSVYAYKFESEKEAQIYIDDFYMGAEGRCSHQEITKEEYENYQPFIRDRALEAFENGKGTAVVL